MIEVTSDDAKTNGVGRIGSQPIALAGAALVIIMLGVGSIAIWRTYTGTSPEQDRIAAARQSQARVAQTSEQLVEKTKGLGGVSGRIDRPVAGGSGSVANRKAASCLPANRHQAVIRSGGRTLRGHRQPAAVLCEHPLGGSIQFAPCSTCLDPQKVPRDKGRASQNRQIARLTSVQTSLQMPVCSMQLSENRTRFFAPFVKWITSARTAGRLDAVHRMA